MKRAHRIEAKEIEFVAPGVPIPRGMITVVSGRAGEGKSTITANWAAQVSRSHPVIFSNHEDPHAEVVRPRLEAADAILERIFLPDQPFMLPEDVGQLERLITRLGARLVVADAALQHLGPSATSGQGVRKALSPLKAMLERTGAGMVFVDHLIKKASRSSHPLEALAGAGSGLPAAARFVYIFGRNPRDPNERILAPVKVNAIRAECSFAYEMEDAAVFTKDGAEVEVGKLTLVNDESDVDASEVIAFNGGGKAADAAAGVKGAIAKEWLIGLLMFGEKPAKELQDEGADSGFSWRTLQRAGDAVGIVRRRDGFGKGSVVVWRLPDEHPALKVAAQMQPPAKSKGKP